MTTFPVKVRWTLQQYGLSQGSIIQLYSLYMSSGQPYEESSFIRFCLTKHTHNLTNPLVSGAFWKPSQLTLQSLLHRGVPQSFINSSLVTFLSFQIPTVPPSTFSFLRYCLSSYKHSSLNSSVYTPTYMVKGWLPADKVCSQLLQDGATQRWLDAAIAEFELFWRERKEPKPNWSRRFLWWARTQLTQRKYSWLL